MSYPLFKNLKLDQVSSTAKGVFSFVIPYIKLYTSKFQHQFNLTTLAPTVSSLTQLYNTDPKLWTCAFIGFMINTDKKVHVHWKQGKYNLSDYPSKHHSTKHQISVRPTYVLNNIQKQTKYLFKLPKTLQGCVKNICHQSLRNRWIINIKCHQWPLRQYLTNGVSLHDTFIPFQNRPSKPVSLNQRRYSNVVLSKTKNILLDVSWLFR